MVIFDEAHNLVRAADAHVWPVAASMRPTACCITARSVLMPTMVS